MSTPSGLVIVIDDDLAVRNSLRFSLELEGLTVRSHSSGSDALADPDLATAGCLVVDLHMPLMNGMDFMAELRRRKVAVPTVLITARFGRDIELRGIRSGFRAVLEKPLQDGALLEAICGALARKPPTSVEALRESI
jgi:two-component system response regulator FixJ